MVTKKQRRKRSKREPYLGLGPTSQYSTRLPDSYIEWIKKEATRRKVGATRVLRDAVDKLRGSTQ